MPKHHHTVRATTMIGTPVENWEGEHLGTIEDVMIDKRHGEITYLTLAYPGDYGVQYPNKRFAVPFESIAMRDMGNHEVEYIINVTEQFLQQAPGFDCNDRPDFADERFTSVLKDYYKDVSIDIRV